MARIFITGSTDGLGRAAARSLLDDGHVPSWRPFIGPPSVTVCNATHGQQAAKPDPAFQGFGLSDANIFRTFEWEIHPNYRALGGQGQYHG
jgi:nucleoside-diphosphate-sugar epimerase